MPRKMLPPPTTRHSSWPCALAAAISLGEAGDRVGIDAELALPHQRLARELQQDPVEARAGHAGETVLKM